MDRRTDARTDLHALLIIAVEPPRVRAVEVDAVSPPLSNERHIHDWPVVGRAVAATAMQQPQIHQHRGTARDCRAEDRVAVGVRGSGVSWSSVELMTVELTGSRKVLPALVARSMGA